MANHKSAKKRIRQTAKRNFNNKSKKTRVRTQVKKLRGFISEQNKEEAVKLFPQVQSLLAKLAKSSATNKRTSARRISRLAGQIAKLS